VKFEVLKFLFRLIITLFDCYSIWSSDQCIQNNLVNPAYVTGRPHTTDLSPAICWLQAVTNHPHTVLVSAISPGCPHFIADTPREQTQCLYKKTALYSFSLHAAPQLWLSVPL